MCKTPTIFLPSGITLFKVITNKVENCINLFVPAFNKLFLPGMETKETSILMLFKQRASITQE